MKRFPYINLLILAILLQNSLYSQTYFDLVNIGYEHASYSSKDASDFNFNRFNARINLGLELNNGDYILGDYYGEIFNLNGIEYPGGGDLDLYSNFLSAGYLHYWKAGEWSILAQVRFKLNSDYYKPSIRDLQLGGWFLFTQKRNEKISLFAGMYYNQEVNKDLFFPIGGLHWTPSEKWNLYILIPATIRFEWILKENAWYVGIESDWTLNTYLMNKNPDIKYFRRELLVTSIFIEKHITDKLVLFGKIGNYQINDYEIYDYTDNLIPKSQFDSRLINNLSVQAGLAYRVRL